MKDNQDHFNLLREIQKKPSAAQRELAVKSLKYFDKLMLNNEFIACNKFSYADIQAAVSLQFLVRLNRIDINDYQNLSAYINNITCRPSFSA